MSPPLGICIGLIACNDVYCRNVVERSDILDILHGDNVQVANL